MGRHGHAVHLGHVMAGHRISGWRRRLRRRDGRGASRLRRRGPRCRGARRRCDGGRRRWLRDDRRDSVHGGCCRSVWRHPGVDRLWLGGRLAGGKNHRRSGGNDQDFHATNSSKGGRRSGSVLGDVDVEPVRRSGVARASERRLHIGIRARTSQPSLGDGDRPGFRILDDQRRRRRVLGTSKRSFRNT